MSHAAAKGRDTEAEAANIQELYLAGRKDEAAAAVPADLLEGMSLVGPAGYVRERVQAFREAGVTVLSIIPMGADPVGVVEQIRDWAS